MRFCLQVCKNTAKMYMESGVDGIAVVDPMVSQISPGCDMPFNTPVENVKAVTSVVYGEVSEFLGAEGSLADLNVACFKPEKPNPTYRIS